MECKSEFLFYLGLRKIEHDLGECTLFLSFPCVCRWLSKRSQILVSCRCISPLGYIHGKLDYSKRFFHLGNLSKIMCLSWHLSLIAHQVKPPALLRYFRIFIPWSLLVGFSNHFPSPLKNVGSSTTGLMSIK